MFHTFAWSPLKFDECFTLLRGHYTKVTNVHTFVAFAPEYPSQHSPARFWRMFDTLAWSPPQLRRMFSTFAWSIHKRDERFTLWLLSGLNTPQPKRSLRATCRVGLLSRVTSSHKRNSSELNYRTPAGEDFLAVSTRNFGDG